MKRVFLLLATLVVMCVNGFAQEYVNYYYKIFSPVGCGVTFYASRVDADYYLTIQVESENITFNDNPVCKMKSKSGVVITLEGQKVETKSDMAALVVASGNSNEMMTTPAVPVTTIYSTAIFPITIEQMAILKDGVAKIRLSTFPFQHERTFSHDLIGKKLWKTYQILIENKDDF